MNRRETARRHCLDASTSVGRRSRAEVRTLAEGATLPARRLPKQPAAIDTIAGRSDTATASVSADSQDDSQVRGPWRMTADVSASLTRVREGHDLSLVECLQQLRAIGPYRGCRRMDSDGEQLLIARAKRGDDVAYEQLLAPLVEPAHKLACGLLYDTHLAEDVVQEASMKAWRKLKNLRDGAFQSARLPLRQPGGRGAACGFHRSRRRFAL